MASIRLESICCLFDNSSSWRHVSADLHTQYVIYNALCVFSASISILGSFYQILPRPSPHNELSRTDQLSTTRLCHIINWLAVADMLAALGILVRACVWIAGYNPTRGHSNHVDFQHIFCAVSSGWIQFCYVCTYSWTFVYAVDVYRLVHRKPSCGLLYHVLGWIVPGILCIGGLLLYYTPSLTECGSELPHYLVTYLSMILVMVGNPILYYIIQKTVHGTLRSQGLYTDQERAILRSIQKKFALVMLVFYICWVPNIVDGIMILVKEPKPWGFIIALWGFMALLNPLQALLNSLVYRGFTSCPCTCPASCFCCPASSPAPSQAILHSSHDALEESTEVSPLLSFRKSGHFSTRSLGSNSWHQGDATRGSAS